MIHLECSLAHGVLASQGMNELSINSRLGHLSFEYPGSVGAGPGQVATEQGPQEAILKELSRHEPYSHLFKNSPVCCDPHKKFHVVNEAEIYFFL